MTIENNGKHLVVHSNCNTVVFEITDTIPLGHVVWNIGKNMPDGWLPICRTYDGTYNVIVQSLKAIRTDKARTIMHLVCRYGNTVKEIRNALQKHGINNNIFNDALAEFEKLSYPTN